MQKFEQVTSRAIPLPLRDVDTDMIIPATFLTSVSREGYGENVFRRLRDQDPQFPFNLDKYKGAEILVAAENFGCGSSREHAVWALTGWGIKAIIAKSFADIFSGNAGKNGLVLVKLSSESVDALLASTSSGSGIVTVSLQEQTVTLPGGKIERFEYNPFRKHCILNGLDDIDYIRSHQADRDAFRKAHAEHSFFTVGQPNN